LKLTAMAGEVPGAGWLESLLHPRNRKEGASVLRNVLAACSGSGNHVVQITQQDLNETEALLRDQFRADERIIDKVMSLLGNFAIVAGDKASFKDKAAAAVSSDAQGRRLLVEGGDKKRLAHGGRKVGSDFYFLCEACKGVELQNPAFTPCGHFLCTECVTPTMDQCPVPDCGLFFPSVPKVVKDAEGNVLFDEQGRLKLSTTEREHPQDAFANMQAGAGVEWLHTARADLSYIIGSAFLQEQQRRRRVEGLRGGVKVDERYTPTTSSPIVPPKVGLRKLFGFKG
jgi:hypothetical protein